MGIHFNHHVRLASLPQGHDTSNIPRRTPTSPSSTRRLEPQARPRLLYVTPTPSIPSSSAAFASPATLSLTARLFATNLDCLHPIGPHPHQDITNPQKNFSPPWCTSPTSLQRPRSLPFPPCSASRHPSYLRPPPPMVASPVLATSINTTKELHWLQLQLVLATPDVSPVRSLPSLRSPSGPTSSAQASRPPRSARSATLRASSRSASARPR